MESISIASGCTLDLEEKRARFVSLNGVQPGRQHSHERRTVVDHRTSHLALGALEDVNISSLEIGAGGVVQHAGGFLEELRAPEAAIQDQHQRQRLPLQR